MAKFGYIKLWRQVLDSDIWDDLTAWRVFETLLFMTDPRGQIKIGKYKLAEYSRLAPTTCYEAIRRLVATGMLTAEPTAGKTIYTISKWSYYQRDTRLDTRPQNRLSTDQDPTTLLEGKNKELELLEFNNTEPRQIPPDGGVIKNLLDDTGPIKYDWQYLGLEIFEKMNAPEDKKTYCMKIARDNPSALVVGAMGYASDYPQGISRWKMFLWKLQNGKESNQPQPGK